MRGLSLFSGVLMRSMVTRSLWSFNLNDYKAGMERGCACEHAGSGWELCSLSRRPVMTSLTFGRQPSFSGTWNLALTTESEPIVGCSRVRSDQVWPGLACVTHHAEWSWTSSLRHHTNHKFNIRPSEWGWRLLCHFCVGRDQCWRPVRPFLILTWITQNLSSLPCLPCWSSPFPQSQWNSCYLIVLPVRPEFCCTVLLLVFTDGHITQDLLPHLLLLLPLFRTDRLHLLMNIGGGAPGRAPWVWSLDRSHWRGAGMRSKRRECEIPDFCYSCQVFIRELRTIRFSYWYTHVWARGGNF